MKQLGSGINGELTFLDIIAIISFLVGLQNLDMNITQEDMAYTTEMLDKKLKVQVDEIHKHLEIQDTKLDKILEDIGHA